MAVIATLPPFHLQYLAPRGGGPSDPSAPTAGVPTREER